MLVLDATKILDPWPKSVICFHSPAAHGKQDTNPFPNIHTHFGDVELETSQKQVNANQPNNSSAPGSASLWRSLGWSHRLTPCWNAFVPTSYMRRCALCMEPTCCCSHATSSLQPKIVGQEQGWCPIVTIWYALAEAKDLRWYICI